VISFLSLKSLIIWSGEIWIAAIGYSGNTIPDGVLSCFLNGGVYDIKLPEAASVAWLDAVAGK
jgi:hypothetical protein